MLCTGIPLLLICCGPSNVAIMGNCVHSCAIIGLLGPGCCQQPPDHAGSALASWRTRGCHGGGCHGPCGGGHHGSTEGRRWLIEAQGCHLGCGRRGCRRRLQQSCAHESASSQQTCFLGECSTSGKSVASEEVRSMELKGSRQHHVEAVQPEALTCAENGCDAATPPWPMGSLPRRSLP